MPVPDDIGQLAARLVPAAAGARRRARDYQKAFIRLREQADKTFSRHLREHNLLARGTHVNARWTREREQVAEQIGLREPIDFQSELRPPREP